MREMNKIGATEARGWADTDGVVAMADDALDTDKLRDIFRSLVKPVTPYEVVTGSYEQSLFLEQDGSLWDADNHEAVSMRALRTWRPGFYKFDGPAIQP